jgi:hypothetical protein
MSLYREDVPKVTTLNPQLREALERLRDYIPEAKIEVKNPACSECGWHAEEHLPEGHAPKDHEFTAGPPDETPFFTEAYLYDLMGKEDARTVLALVRNILRAVGLPDTAFREYI